VVIHDFDFVRVALAKFETDAPAVVHRHRPLIAYAFQRGNAMSGRLEAI
jgi:hypothetical protein